MKREVTLITDDGILVDFLQPIFRNHFSSGDRIAVKLHMGEPGNAHFIKPEQIKPITYLKNRTADLVSQVAESGKTVVITQNGEAKVAVMDVEVYDSWRRAMALLKLVAHSEADVEAGRTVSQREAFEDAEAAIRSAEGNA